MLALLSILVLGIFFVSAFSAGLDTQSSSSAALPETAIASRDELVGDVTFDQDILDTQSTSTSIYLTGDDLIPEFIESSTDSDSLVIESLV